MAGARATYDRLTFSYDRHRAAIDRLVSQAAERKKALVARSAERVGIAMIVLGAVALFLMALLVAGIAAAIFVLLPNIFDQYAILQGR